MKSRRIRPACGVVPFIAVSLLVLLLASPIAARDLTPPVSFETDLPALDRADDVVMPAVDVERYLQEDADRMAEEIGTPLRFAAPHFVSLTPQTAGRWEALAGGARVWRVRVRSAGALTLNFGFTTFRLPPGAMLHAYASGTDTFVGPYRAEDAVEGELWTPVIQGEVAVLELFVPAGTAFEPEIVIGQVNHDYRGFGRLAAEKLMQGSCNNDVICPEGDPWRDDIAAEGVYTLQGYWTCSGQMLNSIGPNPPPYFLTAYHCGITTSNDQTIVIYWNYESPTCGWLCCGSLSDHQSGSLLRARYGTSDFCLVELTRDPDPVSHVYYAGWDATGSPPSSCTAIHHPNCDEKAISFNYDALQVTSYLGYSSPGNGSHWRIDDWEDGTTEPGSSGSGIWDPNHHLVGQLHGGYASCSSITSDWYGRFYVSYTGGGSSSNRLKDWIDPDNTGTRVLDGRFPNDIDTDVTSGRPALTGHTTLFPISPNPTRARSTIFFDMKESGNVRIDVFSASGRLVSTMPAQSFPAGYGSVTWDGTSAGNDQLPAGVYFVRMLVNGRDAGTEKLVLLR